MAEHQLIPRSDRVRAEARDTDWSTLVARAIDDMTRIMQSEGRLLVAGVRSVFKEEIDRVVALVATGVVMMGGAVCMLAAIILFLHEYLMLPWWGSFGIVGLALFAISIALGAFATSRPRTPSIEAS
jgi:Putative Actinobacterial Holin-X, holin superfamily III